MTTPPPSAPALRLPKASRVFGTYFLLIALLLLLPLWIGSDAAAWLARRAPLWRAPLGRLGTVPAFSLVTLATAAAVAVGLPRLPLSTAAGFLLGLPLGLAANLLGTLAGAWAEFALARKTTRHPPAGPQDSALLRRLRRHPVLAIALLRLAPLPGAALNLALALAPCSSLDFLLGSALGFLPAALPAVLVGARLAPP